MATHQAMPSPHMLYTAADEALLWLKQNYWEKQVEQQFYNFNALCISLRVAPVLYIFLNLSLYFVGLG